MADSVTEYKPESAAECMNCGQKSLYQFCALEVHTLPVRDFNGEKKVQALGAFKNFGMCSACAQKRLESILNPIPSLAQHCVPGILIFILGIVMIFLFWNKDTLPLKIFGAAAIFCGITVFFSRIQKVVKQKKEFVSLPKAESLENAAWLCVLEKAPKKCNENDVTYIPVNEKTLQRKNGDLMILYNLLPQIAVQAYERIHGVSEEKKAE